MKPPGYEGRGYTDPRKTWWGLARPPGSVEVRINKYMAPLDGHWHDDVLYCGSNTYIRLLLAKENGTPITYTRGKKTFAGYVVTFSGNHFTVRSPSLKTYKIHFSRLNHA